MPFSTCALLSESYEEFKRNIHNLFPIIIDTKSVTRYVQKVRCTGLFCLFEVQTWVSPKREGIFPQCPVIMTELQPVLSVALGSSNFSSHLTNWQCK